MAHGKKHGVPTGPNEDKEETEKIVEKYLTTGLKRQMPIHPKYQWMARHNWSCLCHNRILY